MPGEFDMRRQQEEATRRMREMQARARNSSRQGRSQAQPSPAQTPPEQPSLEQHAPEQPSPEQPSLEQPAQGQPVSEQPTLEQSTPPETTGTGLLDVLFRDRERTVILALLLLLEGEDGNHELMFALLFLLL